MNITGGLLTCKYEIHILQKFRDDVSSRKKSHSIKYVFWGYQENSNKCHFVVSSLIPSSKLWRDSTQRDTTRNWINLSMLHTIK